MAPQGKLVFLSIFKNQNLKARRCWSFFLCPQFFHERGGAYTPPISCLFPHLNMISFQSCKLWYLIHPWSCKGSKGTFVNGSLQSLHEGSLEITLTVPFIPLTFILFYVLLDYKKTERKMIPWAWMALEYLKVFFQVKTY